jgi:hypothetical protein
LARSLTPEPIGLGVVVAVEVRVEIGALDPEAPIPQTDSREGSGVDSVPQGLLAQLQQLGYLLDGK